LSAPCQLLVLAGPEHGRTIPLADVHVSFLNSRLGGAKFAYIGHLRLVRFRIPDRGAAEREVEMFISQKDGRMSRILTIGAAQLGPTQRSGDRASVIERTLDLVRQARQILRD
jgi:hypothetical protein